MRACHSHVGLPIDRVVVPKRSKPLEDAITLRRVARCHVQDQVDESVVWVVDSADDEGTRVDSLPETSSDLVEVGIACEFDFDDGACDVGLSYPNSVDR